MLIKFTMQAHEKSHPDLMAGWLSKKKPMMQRSVTEGCVVKKSLYNNAVASFTFPFQTWLDDEVPVLLHLPCGTDDHPVVI